MPLAIDRIGVDALPALRPQVVALLQQTVDAGASIGFLPPLAAGEAGVYWQSVEEALRGPLRLLWVAQLDGQVVGSVQLDLVPKANAPHRAEVMKLMVLPTQRRQGIARRLMGALEAQAQALGRTTLVLDTRQGDAAEHLYRSLGYTCIGAIPRYVVNERGAYEASAFYYKLL